MIQFVNLNAAQILSHFLPPGSFQMWRHSWFCSRSHLCPLAVVLQRACATVTGAHSTADVTEQVHEGPEAAFLPHAQEVHALRVPGLHPEQQGCTATLKSVFSC